MKAIEQYFPGVLSKVKILENISCYQLPIILALFG